VYRDTPSIKDDNFSNDFISTCDKLSTTYDNFLVIGELNYDMLSPQKLVRITSFNVGSTFFVKQVGLFIIFVKSKISHTFFKGVHFCGESMS
jgi:hypothetical protein